MADVLLALSDLAERIRNEHQQCWATMNRGLEHALAAGRLLIAAKERVQHGQWLDWLDEHCGIDERLAQKYMRVARDLPKLQAADPANTPRVADLSFRQALDLVAANAKTAQKIKPDERPEVFEEVGRRKVENLADAHEAHVSRGKRRRRQQQAQRAQATIQAQLHEKYPDPLPPVGEIKFCGLDAPALKEVIDELARMGKWTNDLAGKLTQVYEPRLPQLALEAVKALHLLEERLSYSRDALTHAVYALRALLEPGPLTGDKVRQWARTAGISNGLLFLAKNLVGVVIHGTGHLAATCRWALTGYEDVSEARCDDAGTPAPDQGGRWQRRKSEAEERREAGGND